MTEVLMSLGAIAGLALLLTMALVPLFVDGPGRRRPSDPPVPVATQRQAVGSRG